MNIEAEIIADKDLRRDTDAIIQRVKSLPPSRERSLTMRLAPILLATAAVVGWLTLRK